MGIKISQLPAVASATTSDFFPVVQGGATSQESIAQVQTLFGYTGGVLQPSTGGSGVANPTAHGILISEGTNPYHSVVLAAGNVLIGTTAGDPVAATLTAGTNVSIASSSGNITISATGSAGFTWNNITTTSAFMAPNQGYSSDNAALVSLTLPTVSSYGDIVRISGNGVGGWKILQNAGQVIHTDTGNTTVGVGGSLASTARYNYVELRCQVANTEWIVMSVTGNITVT